MRGRTRFIFAVLVLVSVMTVILVLALGTGDEPSSPLPRDIPRSSPQTQGTPPPEKSFAETKEDTSTHDTPPIITTIGSGDEPNGEVNWASKGWIFEMITEVEHQRQRSAMIARIDGYLRNCGSPMEGTGWIFYDSAARYGIEPRLAPAIAQVESSAGLACFAPFNYWGGLSYPSGFSSWQESINTHLDWLHNYYGSPQGPYDCPGYCVPDEPWQSGVLRTQESI
jgi:hypothetical protein